jgi:PIN domain nuclease of toxin-antitoxin system
VQVVATSGLDTDNELLCSAVAGFEIAVKYSLGELELAEPPRTFIDNRIRNNALTPLPITMAHAVRVADLPYHHRDPFDRLLIAQALEEDVPLLSADEILSTYGIRRLW